MVEVQIEWFLHAQVKTWNAILQNKMVEVHIPKLLKAQMKMKIWNVILHNKMVEVQIQWFLHAQMKMKTWNVILQNFTVAILEVRDVCFRLVSGFCARTEGKVMRSCVIVI